MNELKEAQMKREFDVFSMIGVVLVSLGVAKLIFWLPFDDWFNGLVLIAIGFVAYLRGANKHFLQFYPRD